MTTPLSQEQRVELVAKAKAATPGPWAFECGDHSHRYSQVIAESERTIHYKYGSGTAKAADQDERDAAFIAAANPEAILSYEATVQALTVERDEALERVKVLEAGGVVSLADARRAVDACGGTHPPGQEEYGKGYDAALTEADAALVRLGRECVR